jgi:hypothetical protein
MQDVGRLRRFFSRLTFGFIRMPASTTNAFPLHTIPFKEIAHDQPRPDA